MFFLIKSHPKSYFISALLKSFVGESLPIYYWVPLLNQNLMIFICFFQVKVIIFTLDGGAFDTFIFWSVNTEMSLIFNWIILAIGIFVGRGSKTRILIFKAIDICRCRVTLGYIWMPDEPCQVRRHQVVKTIFRYWIHPFPFILTSNHIS